MHIYATFYCGCSSTFEFLRNFIFWKIQCHHCENSLFQLIEESRRLQKLKLGMVAQFFTADAVPLSNIDETKYISLYSAIIVKFQHNLHIIEATSTNTTSQDTKFCTYTQLLTADAVPLSNFQET